jgi:hypothetical protein
MIRIALLALFAAAATRASISDCGSAFQITQLALAPDPPVRGQPVYLTLLFNNNEPAPVTDGSATTAITLNGLPISPSVSPLCEATACPIPLGANNRSTNTTWPDVAGKIISRLTWEDPAGNILLCLLTQVKVLAVCAAAPRSANYWEAATAYPVGGRHTHGSLRGAHDM